MLGSTFREWPLHVTIVPWFRLKTSRDIFLIGLQEIIADIHSFSSEVGKIALFGTVRVNLLPRRDWGRLHEQTLAYIQSNARIVALLNFSGKLYMPHITRQKNDALDESESILCCGVALVEKSADGQNVIIENLELNGGLVTKVGI